MPTSYRSRLESLRYRLRQTRSICSSLAFLACLLIAANAWAQADFVTYFSGSVGGVGKPGGMAFDDDGNFWVVSESFPTAASARTRLNKVSNINGTWTADEYVSDDDFFLFYRSDAPETGDTNPFWQGPQFGIPSSFSLNPAPLTIEVPTGSGGTTLKTYAAGELAFWTDAMPDNLAEPVSNGTVNRPDAVKRLVRYDLRKVDNPFAGISGPTSDVPDFANASDGNGGVFGATGVADWNDVFTQVISAEQFWQASGGIDGGDNFGRQLAWSTDGQSIYTVDVSSRHGGIYKIDATGVGQIQQLWDDGGRDNSLPGEPDSIGSEPAVLHTSVFDYEPNNPGVGDQIITEGSFDSGNSGGVNVFLDTGSGSVTPAPLFTGAEFREFSGYDGEIDPEYFAITADINGDLYLYEERTDGLYRFDTQRRFAKIISEIEHHEYQISQINQRSTDIFNNLQVRRTMVDGIERTELVYLEDGRNFATGAAIEAPVGIIVYDTGDFDRDNDVDQDDLNLFSAALGTRGEGAIVDNYQFDLNGDAIGSNAAAIVDWKDVKVLQQFANIPNGDANFDGLLDFADVDILEANYFTLGGPADKTWLNGDFASIDPAYAFDAVDANLVDEVDLAVLADAWVNDLGLNPITAADADTQGYTGQFRDDLLAAFSFMPEFGGDYNNDGKVDAADFTVWRDSFGEAGAMLDADGDGDGVVDIDDYQIWKDNYGNALPGSDGDFNGDGVVDVIDYTVWRDTLGATGTGLDADGNGDSIVDINDYLIWRGGYEPASGAAAITSGVVPEPASLLLTSAALVASLTCRRRQTAALGA